MPKFVVDRIKGKSKKAAAEADFTRGKVTITGDDEVVAELTKLLGEPLETLRSAHTGDISITATEIAKLEAGTEEHFVALMRDLSRFGYKVREVAQNCLKLPYFT